MDPKLLPGEGAELQSPVVRVRQAARLPRRYALTLLACFVLSGLIAGLVLRSSYRAGLSQWEERLTRIADVNQRLLQTWLAERRWDAQETASRALIAALISGNQGLAAINRGRQDMDAVLRAYPSYSAVYLLDHEGRLVAKAGTPLTPAPAILQAVMGDAGSPELGWGMITKMDREVAVAHFRTTAILASAFVVILMAAIVALAFALWRGKRIYGLLTEIAGRRQAEGRRHAVHRDANQAVVRAQDEGNLLGDVCQVLIQSGGYHFAWVGFAQHDEAKSLKVMAKAGAEQGYLSRANISWADTERGQGPAGVAVRSRQPVVSRDIADDPAVALWRADALARGYQSCIALPLAAPLSSPFGVLCVYSARKDAFDAEELSLLEEISEDVSYGLLSVRARAELQQAEERFELLAGATNDALWDWDNVSDEVWRNDQCLRLFGETGGLSTGIGSVGLAHPADLEQLETSIQAALRTHAPTWSFEYRMLRHDGTYVDVLNHAAILYDADGKAVCAAGGIADLTESKRTQRSMARLAALVGGSQEAILVTTPEGVITDWNDGATQLHGYTPEEAIGRSVSMLIPADRTAQMSDALRKIRQGESVQLDTTSLRKDGRMVHVALTVSPICDAAGATIGYSSIAHDISRLVRAEEFLRRYELMAAYSRDSILFMRFDDGRILEANRTAEIAYGYSREELLSLSIADLRAADAPPLIPEQMAEVLTDGILLEAIHRRKDGSVFPVEVSSHAATILGMQIRICVVRDMTERRAKEENARLEQQLRHAREMETTGKLAGGIAHDFNNILMVIQGYTEMVQDSLPDQDVLRTNTREILKATDRAASLTDQLLALSRK